MVIENLKWADFVLSSDLNQNFSNYMQDLKILVTQKTAYKWNTTVHLLVDETRKQKLKKSISESNTKNNLYFDIFEQLST